MAVVHYPAVGGPARPAISICIANYNGEQLLVDCLESVFSQQGDFSYEVIVHDDASTDGSVAWLRERYPQVELLASDTNVGFCIGNNRMVAQARGEFVLLLNNDAALYPDALASLLAAARAQTPTGILTLPQYDWQSGALVDRGCLLDPFYNPVPNLDPKRHDVAMVIGACLWIPRSLWQQLGGFPEWIESIGEDLYLCGQARLQGVPVQALNSSGYKHWQGRTFGGNKPHEGRLQTSARRRQLSERNKTAALFMLTPGITMWPLLAVHLLALSLEGMLIPLLVRDLRLGRNIYWPAVSLPFRKYRMLQALRRLQQQQRKTSLRSYFSCMVPFPRKLQLLLRHGIPRIR
ncbi:glycosyltransferase [Lysobacter sp. CFH 32150]|uniref:glycosyltransferase family 2 protein n=1 Tax=Lysobacter sp. CFH 32150 TaxID=2927128 RepID=UPI001FA7E73E|nr:glycosyltransferase [Lysobacter sp. CFH 32150]MCI4567732.1 glycosyltransferase [Lysobacter sp. CFH 32150]